MVGDAAGAELTPYKQTCSVQSRFYGALIHAHDGSHFLGAQPFHITEHQGHPIFLRQLVDRLIEGLPLLARVPARQSGARRASVGVVTTTGGCSRTLLKVGC
jgi:hypothetical protein